MSWKDAIPNPTIIVGSGVFGASTALALIEAHPSMAVTLVDACHYPSNRAASHDVNRIVRADYSDIMHMKLALEAMQLWTSSPLYSAWYHHSGLLRVGKTALSRKCMENFAALRASSEAKMIPVAVAKEMWGGVFTDMNSGDETDCYWQPNAGWADAAKALGAVVQEAVNKGVRYLEATVTKVSIAKDETCTGVQLADGTALTADFVMLCTGARTADLLAKSAPTNTQVQTGNRLIGQGMLTFYARIPQERWAEFRDAPVLAGGLEHMSGESIPLNSDGILKFNCDPAFKYTTKHESTGKLMSIPPLTPTKTLWTEPDDIPQGLRGLAQRVYQSMYGKRVAGIELEKYRIGWDCSTPSADFLISTHPHCKNLFLATGGSWHSWKMLPVLGRYVLKALHGTLDNEMTQRWAWDHFDFEGVELGNENKVYKSKIDWVDIIKSRI
ncbi:FAD dependent oxidoreductase [Hypoxylon argillaceum]|nr:FAD dependent oxidoreductase [Hypoxylon argillaceum]